MVVLTFLKNLHTVFHSDCTNLQSHQQCMSVPFSSHPLQHLLFLVFLTIVILMDVKWYGGFDLQLPDNSRWWTSFHTGVEHHIYSLEKCLFRSSAHFSTGLFVVEFHELTFLGDVCVVLAMLCGTWGLSSPTREQTPAPCNGNTESFNRPPGKFHELIYFGY